MPFGLFGKLPQKRDFVAFGVPRAVLEPFEVWLQSAVAASRSELGAAWQEAYLVAPVWRYWIGAAIFGTTCAGVLIPSVDGVGRFFPLTIMYCADEAGDVPPPPFAPLDSWYQAIAARLLGVLDPNAEVAVERLTDGLPEPGQESAAPDPPGAPFRKGMLWQGESGAAGALLPAILPADYRDAAAGRSFWWTEGGASSGAMIYARNALPDPFFFTTMIKGDTN